MHSQNLGQSTTKESPKTDTQLPDQNGHSIKTSDQEWLNLPLRSINQFQLQIASLQNDLKLLLQQSNRQDTVISQSHFFLKKQSDYANGGKLVIQAEYVQDSVFNNLEVVHQQEMNRIFNEAKRQIERLEQILRARDNEIAGLNQQIIKLNSIQRLPSSNVNEAQRLNQELHLRTNQCAHLSRIVQTITLQFDSLKNDNILLVQDIQKLRLKNEEQSKMIQIQTKHIHTLREQLMNESAKNQSPIQEIADRKSDKTLMDSSRASQTIQKLTEQLNKALFDKNSYAITCNLLQAQKIENHKLKQTVQKLRCYCGQLQYDKSALENVIKLNNNIQKQLELEKMKEQMNQYLQMIDRYQNQNKAHIENQEHLQRQIQQGIAEKQNTETLIKQVYIKLKAVEKQSQKNQDIIQMLKIDNQHIINLKNSLCADYEQAESKIERLSLELSNKNQEIHLLEAKLIKSQNKQKSPVSDKKSQLLQNENILVKVIPRNFPNQFPSKLPIIETVQELISYSKELLMEGPKQQNTVKLHSFLDLVAHQLQDDRKQLQKYKMKIKAENTHPNLSFYQHETNIYIQKLLNKLSELELEKQRIINQNYKLKEQVDFLSFGNKHQLISDLHLERQLTQKLSIRIKSLESQLLQLTDQLSKKNDQIYSLKTKVNKHRGELKDVDAHFGPIQNDYSNSINTNRNRDIQIEFLDTSHLNREIQAYKMELEKFIHVNKKLNQQISKLRCSQCQQHQARIRQLQKQCRYYQGMIEQYQRLQSTHEKQIQNKGRINLKTKIVNLKDRTNQNQLKPTVIQNSALSSLQKSKKAGSTQKKKGGTSRTIHKRHTVLDHLVQTQKFTFQCILILMLKIVTQADNEKLFQSQSPVLPEHIEILQYDRFYPENIKVELAESRQSFCSNRPLYLAPERLRGCNPTRKSLVWNIGLVFDFIIHKRPFFKSESEVKDNEVVYRYESKEFPRLREIVSGMLQKEISKRKMFANVKSMISSELVTLNMLRSRD